MLPDVEVFDRFPSDLDLTAGDPNGAHILWDGADLTFTGQLSAASGTFAGTVTAESVIASESFTASDPVFKGSLTVEGGTDEPKLELNTSADNAVMFLRDSNGDAGALSVSGGILTIQGFDGVQIEASGSVRLPGSASGTLGFYGTNPIAKATVTGSRGGNAALASLLSALHSLGLITNSSTS